MNYNKIISNLRTIWNHLKFQRLALADYEDAINEAVELVKKKRDGLLIDLPCKVGDTVYRIDTLDENPEIEIYRVHNIWIDKNEITLGYSAYDSDICMASNLTEKTLYLDFYFCTLSKNEAKAKLKELKENG